MRTRIKICGVRTAEETRAAAEAGADAVGFVLSPSLRRLAPEEAAELAGSLPPFVSRIAVFRLPAEPELREALAGFAADLVQAEPGPVLEAAGVAAARLLPVLHDGPDLLEGPLPSGLGREGPGRALLEGPGRGGRGVRPDWDRAAVLARRTRLVLAGGLTPENVEEAIRRVRPWAVDVSSGVESEPGVKDPGRMEAFAAAVRRADGSRGAVTTFEIGREERTT